MPNLDFKLSFASLIPDFIYQFLSTEYMDSSNLTCMELEDVREAISSDSSEELKSIRNFLAADKKIENSELEIKNNSEEENKLEKMADKLDEELAEVDDEMYHRYTPGELRFIFEKIIENIDVVYEKFKAHTSLNMGLAIGFKTKKGLESNMVVEFLHIDDRPEFLEDVFLVPMGNYMVSDKIIARIYFRVDPEKTVEYAGEFDEAIRMIELKPEG